MRVAVTGTPGTGKTSATRLLPAGVPVIHLNDEIRERGLHSGEDPERDTLVADLDAVREWLDETVGAERPPETEESPDGAVPAVVIESHLAHLFEADRVVVLRCRPEALERRLRARGEPPATARENAESEALDLVLAATVERHGEDAVYEIDATDRSPEAVAAEIEAVIRGEREPSAGTVSYEDYL